MPKEKQRMRIKARYIDAGRQFPPMDDINEYSLIFM